MEMDIVELESVIETLKMDIRMDLAAKHIQRSYQTHKLRRRFLKAWHNRVIAAKKI
jgi:hypothetical protein